MFKVYQIQCSYEWEDDITTYNCYSTLEKAQEKLDDMFQEYYDDENFDDRYCYKLSLNCFKNGQETYYIEEIEVIDE